MIKWKGELGDGDVHMTAEEYCEHKVREQYEKDLKALRKLANNPILGPDVRSLVLRAIACYQDKIMWRNEYIRVMEENGKLMMELRKKDGLIYGTNT